MNLPRRVPPSRYLRIRNFSSSFSFFLCASALSVSTLLVGHSLRVEPGLFLPHPNQSLRYANHQQNASNGIVAPTAHQNGNTKSATNPSAPNVIQNIFLCICPVYP